MKLRFAYAAAVVSSLFADLVLASAMQVAPAAPADAPTRSSGDTATSQDGLDLQLLTSRAALIFAGTVTKVERDENNGSTESSASAIRISFHVDEGIRGVNTGQELTIQEWRGLWAPSQNQRYRVGDKVLVFYHQPSPLGFTSPVSGEAGRFLIKSGELIQLNSVQRRALLRSSRLQVNLSEAQIAKGRVPYESVAKIVREWAAVKSP